MLAKSFGEITIEGLLLCRADPAISLCSHLLLTNVEWLKI